MEISRRCGDRRELPHIRLQSLSYLRSRLRVVDSSCRVPPELHAPHGQPPLVTNYTFKSTVQALESECWKGATIALGHDLSMLRQSEHQEIPRAQSLPLVNHLKILIKLNRTTDRITRSVLVQQALVILAFLASGNDRDSDHSLELTLGSKLTGERQGM